MRCPDCGEVYPYQQTHDCPSPSEPAHAPPGPAAPSSESRRTADPILGAILGDRYEIMAQLGRGGMGVVYKARHVLLHRTVAVKILLKPQESEAQTRFLQEARLASAIHHPNTVYISDYGFLADGRAYIVMEFLEGPTLSDLVREGPVSPHRAVQIAQQIALGLQAVHDQGIVHRDLKPENIFLLSQGDRKDFVKIVDFGIALSAEGGLQVGGAAPVPPVAAAASLTEESVSAVQRRLTLPGTVMGTPQYMSPEQAEGRELDARSDQYALGCILYELLTGTVPFDHSSNATAVLYQHMTKAVPPMRERAPGAAIPESLEQVALRMLSKGREARFPSLREAEQALAREAKGLRPSSGDVWSPGPRPTGVIARATHIIRYERRARPWLLLGLVVLGGAMIAGAMYIGARLSQPRAPLPLPPAEADALRQRAIDVLKEGLRDRDGAVRGRALEMLGQSRLPAVRPLMEPLLADPAAEVQAKAAEGLGHLGERAAAHALSALAERAGPAAPGIAAAAALDELGDERGRRLLRQHLTHKRDDVRLRAAFALAPHGDVDALSALRGFLTRGGLPDDVAVSVLFRLAQAGDAQARADLLGRLAAPGRPDLRLSVAANLARLGEERGLSVLRDGARRPGLEQLLALRLLAGLGEPGGLDLFRKLARDGDSALPARLTALEGLGAAGEPPDLRLLRTELTATEPRLRQATAAAVLQISGRDYASLSEQSLGWARLALGDGDWMTRDSAIEVLGEAEGEGAVSLLSRALHEDREPRVRRSAARALGRQRDPDALEALRQGLADSDADVRQETLQALARVGRKLRQGGDAGIAARIRPWLDPLLKAGSPREQILASAALLRAGDEAQRPRLRAGLSAADEEQRRVAVEQIEGDPDLLAAALGDASQAVRLGAARRLAQLGDRRAAKVLREALSLGGAAGLEAYGLLRRLGEQATPPPGLEALFDNRDARIRRAAVEAMGALPLAEAQPLLLRAARSAQADVRRAAAAIAAELPGGQAVLRVLLDDTDRAARAGAAAALGRLSAPPAPKEPPAPKAVAPPPAKPPAPVAPARPEKEPAEPLEPDARGGDEPAGGPRAASAPAQLLQSGIEALDHKDYRKAQRSLERAGALCARKKAAAGCATLGHEISYHLGVVYEAQERFGDAMAEYEKTVQRGPGGKARTARRQSAQAAMDRLGGRLGRVVVRKLVRRRCQAVTLWLPPGNNRINLGGGAVRWVQVQAKQTAEVKTCD